MAALFDKRRYIMALWNGFEMKELEFEGHAAIVVFPEKANKARNFAIKTEYWGAFPEAEIELVKSGYHLLYIRNDNRWGTDADLDRKARFINWAKEEYSLSLGVPVGMSCGGIFAVKLAAKYPELFFCVYADAPVVNFMSCPCGFGKGDALSANYLDEILPALGLSGISELLAYRDMPLDSIPALIKNKLPLILVAGDSDTVVPFSENGYFIKKAYEGTDIPFELHIKSGCGHHPHGLDDPSIIVDFIRRYEK